VKALFKMLYKNELASSERRRGELMEVDLHIHHLIHSHEGMTNGEIVNIQLEHFERIMRIAVKDKINHRSGKIKKIMESTNDNCLKEENIRMNVPFV
jgi:hypothetical protein